jgi:SAM-dependent methyltransferase
MNGSQPERVHRAATGRSYGGVPIHAGPRVHERALDVLRENVPERASVADLGAGSGALSLRMQDSGYRVTAVDRDVSGIPASVETLEVDLNGAIPQLAEHSFDAVVAVELIEHLDSPVAFLRNALSLVRPGGRLLVSTPNVLHPYSRIKFLAKGTFHLFDEDDYWETGHSTPLPRWLLTAHLREAGAGEVLYGYAGDLEMTGVRRTIVAACSWVARRERCPLGARDGCSTLFVLARVPS